MAAEQLLRVFGVMFRHLPLLRVPAGACRPQDFTALDPVLHLAAGEGVAGQGFANEIRRRLPRAGDKWHLDEVVIKIAGTTHWLWRASPPDSESAR